MKDYLLKIKNLQFTKFAGVGGLIAVFSLLAFYVTLNILKLPIIPVYITIYITATLISYYLNSRYTFKKERSYQDTLKYFLVYIAGLVVGIGLIKLFEYLFNLEGFLLILAILVPRSIFTYLLSKYLVFAKSKDLDA